MDISSSYQSNNGIPLHANAGGDLGYDLQSEKQEIEKITNEVRRELITKWKKSYVNAQIFPAPIAAMHPDVVDFLLSFSLVSVYDNIARQANLDAKGRNVLPKIVWQIAEEKNWNSLDQILESSLPLVHSAHVQVAQLLRGEILSKIQVISEKPVAKKILDGEPVQNAMMTLPLAQALEKFPKLEEQNITSDQIKLRYMPAPVRPSIKNWMIDFHDAMGSMTHSPIDRGNFLFHSENGKKLSSSDRQKLGAILKSLDEQSLVIVDPDLQAVIFEKAEHIGVVPDSDENQQQNRNDIDLRQSQFQQHQVSHDVFGDVAPVSGSESIQNPQLQKRVEGFFAEPIIAENSWNVAEKQPATNIRQSQIVDRSDLSNGSVSNGDVANGEDASKAHGGIVKNFFSSFVAPVPAAIEAENKKSELERDPFQLPKSKPPIGSEHFNVISAAMGSNSFANEKMQIPEKRTVDESVERKDESQNRDSMSDDLLYEMLQEKAVSAQGTVRFSSPQKFSAEQSPQSTKIQPASKAQESAYHITPLERSYEKKQTDPKVQGNVVDLKN